MLPDVHWWREILAAKTKWTKIRSLECRTTFRSLCIPLMNAVVGTKACEELGGARIWTRTLYSTNQHSTPHGSQFQCLYRTERGLGFERGTLALFTKSWSVLALVQDEAGLEFDCGTPHKSTLYYTVVSSNACKKRGGATIWDFWKELMSPSPPLKQYVTHTENYSRSVSANILSSVCWVL